MAMPEPFGGGSAVSMQRYVGQTTISSRVCPATSGKKSRKKSRVWSGVLYIFQLAAITFILMDCLSRIICWIISSMNELLRTGRFDSEGNGGIRFRKLSRGAFVGAQGGNIEKYKSN